jgi:hypothetical protein
VNLAAVLYNMPVTGTGKTLIRTEEQTTNTGNKIRMPGQFHFQITHCKHFIIIIKYFMNALACGDHFMAIEILKEPFIMQRNCQVVYRIPST